MNARTFKHCFGALALIACAAPALRADTVVVDFEQFTDSEILSGQVPGMIFSNAIVLTEGISLNEFEFPPYSGANVASDFGGPLGIEFLTPVFSVGGYFTYTEPFTLTAYDDLGNVVATAASLFSNNEALSGDSGSSPNEFLMVEFPSGISMVSLQGDPNGGSFTLDNLTVSDASEPNALAMVLTGAGLLLAGLRRRIRR